MNKDTPSTYCNHNRTHPWCVGVDRMFGLAGTFPIIECEDCGWLLARPALTPKELKNYYPSNKYYSYYEEQKESIFGLLRKKYIQYTKEKTVFGNIFSFIFRVPAIPSYIKKGIMIDIGCGSGGTMQELQSIGWDVYGIDMDKVAIARAKKRGLKHAMYGTFEDIHTFKSSYFDCIRMYHVIEHLDNPDYCVELIEQKIKKGGQVIIGTPNRDSLIARMGKTYWYHLDAPRHRVIFSPRTLRKLLESKGLTITSYTCCSGGGIIGTLQYYLKDQFGFQGNLINTPWLVILVYPIDWILDRCMLGDIFVITATKK